jgi:MoxR-like ATPase
MTDLYTVENLRLSLADMAAKPLLGSAPRIEILKGLSFSIPKGAVVGIVGGSGSGKSTLGRALVRLLEPSGGTIRFDGTDITHLDETQLRPLRRRFQMIFQDPMSSLNPRHRVGTIIAEPLRLHRMDSIADRVATALDQVGLPKTFATRFPHELSGGQRQRVGIARAIALEPEFILADEINRAPAKVQSALLEAMQERQVTIGEESFPLAEPFLVLATQNPLEQEGTYPLPEAQLDRFMLKVQISYPTLEEERLIMRNQMSEQAPIQALVSPEQILNARNLVRSVYMDEKIERYILDIVFATREPEEYRLHRLKPFISYGASPRASINLALAAKAYAFIKRRGFVIPEDVRAVCADVLRHRIGLTYEAEAENMQTDQIIQEIINSVEVP